MQRNAETLSTRDLASSNEPAGGVTTSEDDVRDAAAREGQPGVYDQSAPVAERIHLPVDEQTAPPGEARTGASATDQPVEASRPDAGLGIERGAPGQGEDRPAKSTQAVSMQDQDAEAAPPSTGGRPPPRTAGRCFRPTWTPRSNKGGRRSRPGSSMSPEARSRTPMAWWRTSCSNSQRASPRNGNGSKHNGAVARTSPPRTCGSPCSVTGRSSSACCRPDNRSGSLLEAPRTPRGRLDAMRPRRLQSGGTGQLVPGSGDRLPSNPGSGPIVPERSLSPRSVAALLVLVCDARARRRRTRGRRPDSPNRGSDEIPTAPELRPCSIAC